MTFCLKSSNIVLQYRNKNSLTGVDLEELLSGLVSSSLKSINHTLPLTMQIPTDIFSLGNVQSGKIHALETLKLLIFPLFVFLCKLNKANSQ